MCITCNNSKLRVGQQPVANYLNQLRKESHSGFCGFRQLFHVLTWPKLLLYAASKTSPQQKISRCTIKKIQKLILCNEQTLYDINNLSNSGAVDQSILHYQIIQEAIYLLLQAIYDDIQKKLLNRQSIINALQASAIHDILGKEERPQVAVLNKTFYVALSGSFAGVSSCIPYNALIQILQKRIHDGRLLTLIWQLTCSLHKKFLNHELSTLLLNIYLQECDYKIQQMISPGIYLRSGWEWIAILQHSSQNISTLRQQIAQDIQRQFGFNMNPIKFRHLKQGIDIAGYRIKFFSVSKKNNCLSTSTSYQQIQFTIAQHTFKKMLEHITQHFRRAYHASWQLIKTLAIWKARWQRWQLHYAFICFDRKWDIIVHQLKQQLWHYLKRRGYQLRQRYRIINNFFQAKHIIETCTVENKSAIISMTA